MFKLLCFTMLLFGLATSLQGEVPPCFKQIERDFFRPDLVSEALSIQNVNQSNWSIINYELQKRAAKIPEMIRERSKHLIPNPLDEPYDSVGAQALLEETLEQVLAETLSLFKIDNRAKIGEIYGYIKQKQIDRFNRCFTSPP